MSKKEQVESRIEKQLFTTQEAAKFLGLSPQTLYNWRCQRKGIDYVKIGGATRYELEALERYINSNRVCLNAK